MHTTPKIRVAHIVYAFGTGGLEKGVATVVRNASEDLEHVIVCLHSSGESERLLPPGTPVIELYKPAGNSPIFLWKLARTLKRVRPTIVHARNWGGTDGIIAARLAGVRAAVQGEHGWEIDDPAGLNAKRLFFRRILDFWIDEYTAVSRHLGTWLTETVKVRKPVAQIYNGVDTDVFFPASGSEKNAIRAEFDIPDDAFIIGIVGRLDQIKDHPTLFQAFTGVKQVRPDAHLLVVGDGPERERLEALADDGCLFLGNRLDVPAVLRGFDLFVLPSLNEGISNTILEAMATGLPVVACRVGGNPELLDHGQTGTLVPPGDSDALAAAILQYAQNRTLQDQQGAEGRKTVLQQFSVQSMVAGYENVYRRVAKNS